MLAAMTLLVLASRMVPGYQCELSMITTSDWTSVSLGGAPFIVLEQTVVQSPDRAWVSGLSIRKPAYDSSRTSVLYDVVLPESIPSEVKVFITKGDIGWTRVSLSLKGSERPIFAVKNNENRKGDPRNEQTSVVNLDSLLRDAPRRIEILTCPGVPKLTLAFYYGWYGNPKGPSGKWIHWDPSRGHSSSHHPLLGHYDSLDPEIMRRHIRWAKESGIDGFVVSWWREKDNKDVVLNELLKICEREKFKVCVLMEIGERLEESIRYLDKRYFKSPGFLKVNGRPVVFYYERALKGFEKSELKEMFEDLAAEEIELFNVGDGFPVHMLDIFDGCFLYNPIFLGGLRDFGVSMSMSAHSRGKLFAATVAPGFDQRVTRVNGRYMPRERGRVYRRMWEYALEAEADWILITSFNEWHEGTEIEPSTEFQTLYLDLTRRYSKIFGGPTPRSSREDRD